MSSFAAFVCMVGAVCIIAAVGMVLGAPDRFFQGTILGVLFYHHFRNER